MIKEMNCIHCKEERFLIREEREKRGCLLDVEWICPVCKKPALHKKEVVR